MPTVIMEIWDACKALFTPNFIWAASMNVINPTRGQFIPAISFKMQTDYCKHLMNQFGYQLHINFWLKRIALVKDHYQINNIE